MYALNDTICSDNLRFPEGCNCINGNCSPIIEIDYRVTRRLLDLLIKKKIDIEQVKVYLEHQSSKDPVIRDMCKELLIKYENE